MRNSTFLLITFFAIATCTACISGPQPGENLGKEVKIAGETMLVQFSGKYPTTLWPQWLKLPKHSYVMLGQSEFKPLPGFDRQSSTFTGFIKDNKSNVEEYFKSIVPNSVILVNQHSKSTSDTDFADYYYKDTESKLDIHFTLNARHDFMTGWIVVFVDCAGS